MKKPLGSKYLILVPTVLNIAILYALAAPLGWFVDMLTPLAKTILMCCGVAAAAVMALAYVRVDQDSDQPARPRKNRPQQPQPVQAQREDTPATPMGATIIPTSSEAIGAQKNGTMVPGGYSPDTSETSQPDQSRA